MRSLRDKGTLSDVRGRDNPHAHPAGDFWLLRYPRRGRRHGNEFTPTQGAQSSLPGYERCLTGRVCSVAAGFFSKNTRRSITLDTAAVDKCSKVAASLGLEA